MSLVVIDNKEIFNRKHSIHVLSTISHILTRDTVINNSSIFRSVV